MKINISCSNYIESTSCSNLSRDEAIELYRKSFAASDKSLMDYYFKYFAPYNNNIIDEKIYKYYTDLMEKRESFTDLCKLHIENEVLEKLLNNLPILSQIMKYIEINFFIGIGTAHGFTSFENNKAFVNIALERFVDSKEPYKAMECTIIHELIHLTRVRTHMCKWGKLGYSLIEEGLACLLSKTVLDLPDEYDDLVFPGVFKLSDEEYNKFTDLYLDNINSEDASTITRLMHSGDPGTGVKPGLGYIIGAKLLGHYIEHKNIDIYELIYSDNDTIVSHWLELRESLTAI